MIFTNLSAGNERRGRVFPFKMQQGGYVYDEEVRVINSIMYNDTAPVASHIYNGTTAEHDGYAVVSYSDIQGSGGSGNWVGSFGLDVGSNVDCDPLFLDYSSIYGSDDELGTDDDGLIPLNPYVIDASDGISAKFYDIRGHARIDRADAVNSNLGYWDYTDMGAYERGDNIYETANVLVMCFIDESSAYGSMSFEEDLAKYNSLTSYPGFVVRAGCYVPPQSSSSYCSIYDVLPNNPYPVPNNIHMQLFHEYSDRCQMDDDWFKTIFNQLCDGVTPDYIFLFVDNSGSLETEMLNYYTNPDYMTGQVFSEGFSGFVSWVLSEYPNAIFLNDAGFTEESSERWLEWVNDALVDEFIN